MTVHSIGKDGALSEKPVQTILTADKAHAILPDPSNRFVFVPHTGPNATFQFTFSAETGRLVRCRQASLVGDGDGIAVTLPKAALRIVQFSNPSNDISLVSTLRTDPSKLLPDQSRHQ